MATGASSNSSLPYPVSAEISSVVDRGDNKSRYAFEVNVQWSDGTGTTCHRGYQDFFQFQCELLDSFPEEAGTVKGHERVLPYIPGKQLFRRSTRNLAMERQPKLHQYLQELLALPENISQSEIVFKFLNDNWREIKSKHNTLPPEVSLHAVESNTPDELLKSMEAVDMSKEGVRFINDRNTPTDNDSLDDIVCNEKKMDESLDAITSNDVAEDKPDQDEEDKSLEQRMTSNDVAVCNGSDKDGEVEENSETSDVSQEEEKESQRTDIAEEITEQKVNQTNETAEKET